MKAEPAIQCVQANWPAPANVRALSTTRLGGYSTGRYAGLNLAMHVGDDADTVARNRESLSSTLKLPSSPMWLNQVHGERLIDAAEWQDGLSADACYTGKPDTVCAILTADCLPLLLCNEAGTRVAAIHLGWRGICSSLIPQAINRMDSAPSGILAWIGPHIHAESYEVGADVLAAASGVSATAMDAFTPTREDRWLLSMSALVAGVLKEHGLAKIYMAESCVYRDSQRFYSYRREHHTGRMASLIWMET